jgi:hypothetical protein
MASQMAWEWESTKGFKKGSCKSEGLYDGTSDATIEGLLDAFLDGVGINKGFLVVGSDGD